MPKQLVKLRIGRLRFNNDYDHVPCMVHTLKVMIDTDCPTIYVCYIASSQWPGDEANVCQVGHNFHGMHI